MNSGPNHGSEESKISDLDSSNEGINELDPSKRKGKASDLRKQALDLDEQATKLRDEAIALEQKAAKLRIESWQIDGSVSAVTKSVTIEDKFERQLAELDLMAEDYMDDKDKFEWYRQQRQLLLDMIGAQKEQERLVQEEVAELKESLVDIQVRTVIFYAEQPEIHFHACCRMFSTFNLSTRKGISHQQAISNLVTDCCYCLLMTL
jgi:hypothetical protein